MKTSLLYALAAVLFWSTMPIVGKSLLTQFNSLEVLGYGSLIGAVFLSVLLLFSGRWRAFCRYTKRYVLQIFLTGFVGYFLYSVLYNEGLSLLPAHVAGTLNYTWPIFAIVLSAIFLKEKITARSFVSIAISMAGICVMMGNTAGSSASGELSGYVCCLAAAVLYAVFNIANKKIGKDELPKMTLYLYIGGIFALLCNIPNGFTRPDGRQTLGFLWIGIVIDALAYLLWAMALMTERTSLIVNLSYLTPVLSAALSVLVFREEITSGTLAGLVLILAGVLLQAGKSRQPA